MYAPALHQFTDMIGQADLVPVSRTIIADLDTPLTIFAKVAGDATHAFLFESMEGGEKWGRYSFIGLDPLLRRSGRMKMGKIGQAVVRLIRSRDLIELAVQEDLANVGMEVSIENQEFAVIFGTFEDGAPMMLGDHDILIYDSGLFAEPGNDIATPVAMA